MPPCSGSTRRRHSMYWFPRQAHQQWTHPPQTALAVVFGTTRSSIRSPIRVIRRLRLFAVDNTGLLGHTQMFAAWQGTQMPPCSGSTRLWKLMY
jgi:hypothetical protein